MLLVKTAKAMEKTKKKILKKAPIKKGQVPIG